MKFDIIPKNINIPKDVQIPSDYAQKKQNVEYGIIQDIEYKAENQLFRAKVLLPPKFNPKVKYPTLYLLSGMGSNYEWTTIEHVDYIIGNLGNMVMDLIVVMPEILNIKSSSILEKKTDYSELRVKMPFLIQKIEDVYPVLKGRENRSIAGLSMGGMCALYLSCIFDNTPYAFSTIGAISPSISLFEELFLNKKEFSFNKENKYNFCLSTGTRDALLIQGAKRYQKLIKEGGFGCSFFTIEEKGHNWDAFSPLFYEFFVYYFKR